MADGVQKGYLRQNGNQETANQDGELGALIVAGADGDPLEVAATFTPSGTQATSTADGADVAQGAKADAAWSGTGDSTVVAALKAIWTRLRGGQQTKANSLPVTLASDTGTLPVDGSGVTQPVSGTFFQATQPVSAASLPLPASAAQEHATAGSPHSARLTDGTTYYKATTPSDTQPVSGTFWQATQPVSGTFWQATQPVSGTFWQATQPISLATGTGRTLLFASISCAGSGDNTIIAAGTNKLKIVSYVIVATGAVNARWYSGAGGTALSGAMALAASGGVSAISQPSSPMLQTAAATALVLNLSGAVQVSGHISYFDEA